jgi:hypothetical protein
MREKVATEDIEKEKGGERKGERERGREIYKREIDR